MTKKKKKSEGSSRIYDKFVCTHCFYEFWRKGERFWRSCPKCKHNARLVPQKKTTKRIYVHDMTKGPDYFKKKKFMMNNKAWREDIMSRRTLSDGTVGRFQGNKRIG